MFAADLPDDAFDVVIGNPPFLTKLRRATVGDHSRQAARSACLGDAPPAYIDEAALFLVLALRLARADGGRVAFVQPMATLATRDSGWARSEVLKRAALENVWMSTSSVFAADVPTCALGLHRGATQSAVERTVGEECAPLAPMTLPTGATWSPLLADALGAPALDLTIEGCVGDIASVTADFRDEFYEIASLVEEGADGAQVVTTGLIDPGRSRWGEVPATIAGSQADAADCQRVGALNSLAGSPGAESPCRDANAGDRSRRRREPERGSPPRPSSPSSPNRVGSGRSPRR